MSVFRRRDQQSTDTTAAIGRFWKWWDGQRKAVVEAADARDSERVTALLKPAVAELDPSLTWEVRPGQDARYALVVSGGGRPELRSLAERWYLAAPEPDDDIEYAPARRRDPRVFTSTLTIDDYDIPLDELVAGTRLDQQRLRLDVVVHHPLFPLLDEASRLRVAYLGLDAALGEDDVERWLGNVEISADPPVDSVPVSSLPTVVDQLRPPGDQWVVLKGSGPRGTVIATVRRPFTRADRPLCDTHVVVTLSYPTGDDGLPAEEGITTTLQDLEQHIVSALGGDGPHAVLVGHELAGGWARIHAYVDGLAVKPKTAKPVLRNWQYGSAKLQSEVDPAWRGVGHLLG